jgi:hypothetical protein
MLNLICLVRNGHIKRITDQDIQSSVLEIMGTNVSTNYITCPADPKKTLGIKLPFLVMIIKNVSSFFIRMWMCWCQKLNVTPFQFSVFLIFISVEEVLHIRSSSSG